MKRYFLSEEKVHCRILHVEDCSADVLLTQTFLSRAGFSKDRLTHVDTLEAAKEKLEHQTYDFILLDLNLPDSRGLSTFEECFKWVNNCPVIVLTGASEREVSKASLDHGAFAFLQKDSMNEGTLFNTIYGVLKRALYEKELKELRKKAEAADQDKTRFLGLISHELRTPLSAIIGFTELLLENPVLSGIVQEHLHRIRSNSLHLRTLVNDLVDLSQLELGLIDIQMTKINLKSLLEDVVESVRVQRPGTPLNLKCVSEETLPTWIYSDETKLRQILLNLLGNAIKFSREKGVELSIQAKDVSSGLKTLIFHVADDGSGIALENQKHLFQPYGRVHSESEQRQGAGLGLALSQRLARALGGNIQLDFSNSEGSQFTALIQVETQGLGSETFQFDSSTFEGKIKSVNQVPVTTIRELKGQSVLIIEDAADLRELYRVTLQTYGVSDIEKTDSGRDGVQKGLSRSFDCVLLDLSLPDMDGFQVAKDLRAGGYRGRIVGITAHTQKALHTKALLLGFDQILTKPVPVEVLTKAIATPTEST